MRMPGMRQQQIPLGETQGKKRDILMRLVRLVMRHYKFSLLTVAVCIIVTAVTTLASTLFTRTLIDDYIVPMTQTAHPNFAPLAQTLFKLAAVLVVGVICS